MQKLLPLFFLALLPLAGCADENDPAPSAGIEDSTPTDSAPPVVDPTETLETSTPSSVTPSEVPDTPTEQPPTPTLVSSTPSPVTPTPTPETPTPIPVTATPETPTSIPATAIPETPTPETPTPETPTVPPATPIPDADGDGFSADLDCDDSDPTINPDAAEICTSEGDLPTDEDCDGLIDDSDVPMDPTTWYADFDSDGYGHDTAPSITQCSQPDGYVETAQDCDDTDADVSPKATEICNGIDDNCNGLIDDEDTGVEGLSSFWGDGDGDGFGNPESLLEACEAPEGSISNDDDCNDDDEAIHPNTVWYLDFDEDNFGGTKFSLTQCEQPTGYILDSTDCEDANSAVNPEATEVCNSLDDDCDDLIDDADDSVDPLGFDTFYVDIDGDTWGNEDFSAQACAAPDGHVAVSGDCDDNNADIHPEAPDPANGVDDNCDGVVDDGLVYDTCLDYHLANPSLPDGVYTIDPDGEDGDFEPVDAYCDMTTDGGGWTLMATLNTAIGFPITDLWGDWAADWFSLDHGNPADPTSTFSNHDARRFNALVEQGLVLRASAPDGEVKRFHYGFTPQDWALWDDLRYASNGVRIVGPFNNDNVVVSSISDGYAPVKALSNGHWDDGVFYLGSAAGGGNTDGEGLGARFHVGSNTSTFGYAANEARDTPWHLWVRRGLEPCDGGEGADIGDAERCPAMDCLDIFQERPEAEDGMYWIDPDGFSGAIPAFETECDISGGGWTVLSHDRQELSDRVSAETESELALEITYDAPNGALAALSGPFSQREQYFYKKCHHSVITVEGGSAHNRVESLAGDKISLELSHFDGSPLACNINDYVDRESAYTLVDKVDILPMVRMWAGDSGDPSEEAYYQIGAYRVRRLEDCSNGEDDDGDGQIDEGSPGYSPRCTATRCAAILEADSAALDGVYWLDPDGANNGLQPFQATCDMSGGGWTVIEHDLEGQAIDGNGVGDNSQLVTELRYGRVSSAQLAALIDVSESRNQDFRKDCKGALINQEFGSQHNAFSTVEGSKISSTVVYFGVDQTECDINDETWRFTEHRFEDLPIVPIMAIWGGDSDHSTEDSTYEIGPLRVY